MGLYVWDLLFGVGIFRLYYHCGLFHVPNLLYKGKIATPIIIYNSKLQKKYYTSNSVSGPQGFRPFTQILLKINEEKVPQ